MAEIRPDGVSTEEIDIPKEHTVTEVEDVSSTERGLDKAMNKKITRRIDWRIVPVLGAMYGISLMDRQNVSNAAIVGLREDLEIVEGSGYNIVNMTFYITYILFQPGMIILCRKLGPRFFLPSVTMLWGGVIIAFGFAPSWQILIALRLILGALESAFFPGCLYLLSCWYSKFETARRYSLFFFTGSAAGAIAGILAYGLSTMEGLAGIRGWRWIFILEGVITCAIALFAGFFIVKFPDEEMKKPSPNFLSKEQLQFVVDKVNADRGDVELEAFTWKRFLEPATDWYIYAFPWFLFLVTLVVNAFALTMPIILRVNLGFSIAKAQCLGAPPYFFAGILMYVVAWISDKTKVRGGVLIGLACLSLIGVPIIAFAKNPWVRYFGVFVTVSGSNSSIPAIMTYQANNIRGQWRRAFCSASLTGLGGIGSLAGTLIFRAQDAPEYIPGYATCIVANVLIIITVLVLSTWFKRKNRQADRGECVLLGDPNFRFVL